MDTTDIIYNIPFPYQQFTDTKFILTDSRQGTSLFIPDDCYTRINDYQISFPQDNELGITNKSEIRFIFMHLKNKRWLGKVEYHFKVEYTGQAEFYFDLIPYNQMIYVEKRIYVFYNRKRQTRGYHYYVDDYRGKVVLINKRLRSFVNDRVDVVIVYSQGNKNGAIQELPQSGYIALSKFEIDRNYNPNLMAVFVNGKLLDKQNILQLTNSLYKVDTDIKSRYNLEIRGLSPKINALIPYYKQHCTLKEDKNYENKNIYCRIEVIRPPKGRQKTRILFNPIYFFPELIEDPKLWINLLLVKSSVEYDLKLYGDDYTDDPTDLNVIMQLRLQTQRKLIKNSQTTSLVGKIPGHIHSNKQDQVLVSIQVKTIIKMDKTQTQYALDGVIGKLQANIREFNPLNPIYYELISDGFDKKVDINLFRWSVSTEEGHTGKILWDQEVPLEPDNKIELLEGS